MDDELARQKIDIAQSAVTQAEAELESVLRDLEVVARAEKSMITSAVERAFAKVRLARAKLADLQSLVSPAPQELDRNP